MERGVTEQSHRREMNEAIRAQRRRGAAPRLDVPLAPPVKAEPPPPEEPPAEPKPRGLLDRFRRRG
jgi:hypothetical protein